MKPAISPEEPEFFDQYFERARTDLAFYTESSLQILTKQAQVVPFRMNEAQRIVQADLTKQLRETGKIRAIVLKARQEGVSTLTAARFFRAIHLWPGITSMVVASSIEQAGVLFDIYERYLNNLPDEIRPEVKASERRRYLKFSHESSLSIRPASDLEAGRAMTLHRLHASELAYWGPGARETWVSLLQAVPHDSGEIIVESTPKGAGGLFHELWERAVRDGDWLAIFLPWWIHEEYEMPEEWGSWQEYSQAIVDDPDDFEKQALGDGIPYRGEQHRLGFKKLVWRRAVIVEKFGGNPDGLGKDATRQFQQEYPATAEEAFLVSGACFFDEDRLRRMTMTTTDPEVRGRLTLEVHPETRQRTIRVSPNSRAACRIYEQPDDERHYVVGADTAEGRLVAAKRSLDAGEAEHGGRDFSAAVVLRLGYIDKQGVRHPSRVAAELHGPLPKETFAEQLRLLGEYYSCGNEKTRRSKALLGVERSHSSGQTILRLLREHYKYTPLYWARGMNRRSNEIGQRLGWITDGTSRMPMLDDFAAAVRNDQIEIPSRDLVREMVTFVVWENGKPMAEEGTHDDRVIAAAVAFQMGREHRHGWQTPIPSYEASDTQSGN